MNYIKQLNAFWEKEKSLKGLDAQVQSYYFAMLFFANKYGFAFSVYREDIMEYAKISKNTYYKVRQQAKDLGLVDFTEGENKRVKCNFTVSNLYQICDTKTHEPSQICDTPCDTTKDTTPPEPSQKEDTTCDHTNKLINNKTTNTIPASSSGTEVGEGFFNMFQECHKIYPGTTQDAKTDFAALEAKYKSEFSRAFFGDIYLGIKRKIKADKALAKQPNAFIPKWPYFKNYLSERKWELQTKEAPPTEPEREPSAFNSTEEHYDYWTGASTSKPSAA